MNIFDLLFIVLFLAAVISLVAAGIAAIRKRRANAQRILLTLGVSAAIYMVIVCVVSAATPAKILNIGDPQCNDDWCISVESADRVSGNSAISHDVSLRLFSRASRVFQRENHVVVYLTDDQSHRFDPIPQSSDTPFNVLLSPGESVTAHRTFRLPADAHGVGLVVTREGGALGCFPGCFVITENDWFHKPPVVRLD
jgi:hypothetical protein